METGFSVNDKVLIETAGGLCPVTIVSFEGKGDGEMKYAYVRYAEGDEAIVNISTMRPSKEAGR